MTGTNAESFRPLASFADAGFSGDVLKACAKFAAPTPIQAQCWPPHPNPNPNRSPDPNLNPNPNPNPNPNLNPNLKPNPNPNPNQAQCWPPLIAGRDTIGVAKTGSGKTLAFFLPLLEKLLGKKRSGVRVLILAPTRELAMQSEEVCKAAGGACGVGSVCIYGGLT